MENTIFAEFAKLYRTKGLVDNENRFVQDGIINPDLFFKQTIKILFIAKEHNDLNPNVSDDVYQPGYSGWWNQHVHLQFSHRIGEWAYGIINGFPDYSEINYQRKHEALKSIAFINVKKTSGGASSKLNVIMEYISKSKELLQRQIGEIAPTIIICCFRYDKYVESLLDTQGMLLTPNGFGFTLWQGIPVINFYHPSSRISKFKLYKQLEEAVNCLMAKQLELGALKQRAGVD